MFHPGALPVFYLEQDMQRLTERQKRANVAYQFEAQHENLGFEIKKRHSNYKYDLYDTRLELELVAITLQSSFDFYEYRLNRATAKVDLLLVQRHNAVTPVATLELATGEMFTAGALPRIERPDRKNRNHEEVNLFVSKLILGLQGVNDELQKMPPRTQQWYLERRDAYLRGKIGRPWAS